MIVAEAKVRFRAICNLRAFEHPIEDISRGGRVGSEAASPSAFRKYLTGSARVHGTSRPAIRKGAGGQVARDAVDN